MYVGRFAPSPTGALHAGSLVAALASWLDARAARGRWLLRIEDVDTPRCVAGADALIVRQLAACGLQADAPPLRQSTRGAAYARALARLAAAGRVYPCSCSRSDIARALRAQGRAPAPGVEWPYPGTCRDGCRRADGARAQRLRLPDDACVRWSDRRLGERCEDVAASVGDFVLRRADGLWAYQLAVVVDDAAQGVTDVVRGEDLATSTARQLLLQRALGLPSPRYLHVALVLDGQSRKLSKSDAAAPLVPGLGALRDACRHLGVQPHGGSIAEQLESAVVQWRELWR